MESNNAINERGKKTQTVNELRHRVARNFSENTFLKMQPNWQTEKLVLIPATRRPGIHKESIHLQLASRMYPSLGLPGLFTVKLSLGLKRTIGIDYECVVN